MALRVYCDVCKRVLGEGDGSIAIGVKCTGGQQNFDVCDECWTKTANALRPSKHSASPTTDRILSHAAEHGIPNMLTAAMKKRTWHE